MEIAMLLIGLLLGGWLPMVRDYEKKVLEARA